MKTMSLDTNAKNQFDLLLSQAIGRAMLNSQIPRLVADGYLKEIITAEIDGFFLKQKEKQVLRIIGERGRASPSDYKDFSFKSMQDFSSNYLTKFYNSNLLVREQEGRKVNYRLRGIANLAYKFGLLNN